MAQQDNGSIGPGTSLTGDLTGSGPLTVWGQLRGSVALDGDLVVETGAVVEASVRAGRLVVRGVLRGAVDVRGTVSLESGSEVSAELRCGRLSIQEGARFDGSVDMQPEPAP
jgi:cytoskeletal protein CcmA (bactofilin family)